MNDLKKDKKQILENQLRKEERYYYPPFLNKWFAISSILFLLSMLWLFYFDNDGHVCIFYFGEFHLLYACVKCRCCFQRDSQNVLCKPKTILC